MKLWFLLVTFFIHSFLFPEFRADCFISTTHDNLTQTEAYLSRPELIKKLDKLMNKDLPDLAQKMEAFRKIAEAPKHVIKQTRFMLPSYLSKNVKRKTYLDDMLKFDHNENFADLITSLIKREKEFAQDYNVFYHGQQSCYLVMADLIREVLKQTKNIIFRDDFQYIRIPGSESFEKIVDTNSHGDDNGPDADLSVNLSAFGNSDWYEDSSWAIFIANMSVISEKVGEPWNYFLEKLGIDKSYVTELEKIVKEIRNHNGNLLQIFIPKKCINDYVYLTNTFIAQNPYTARNPCPRIIEELAPDPRKYLDVYCKDPKVLPVEEMDHVQARIRITEDLLLNPQSAVKIYNYTMIPQEKMLSYRKKLADFVARALAKSKDDL